MKLLAYLAAYALLSALTAVWIGRRLATSSVPLALPCDLCDAMTPVDLAHTHHHEPGCGINHPAVEACHCDWVLCKACCPCDLAALIGGGA